MIAVKATKDSEPGKKPEEKLFAPLACEIEGGGARVDPALH